jgi:sugar phosphate isomerase/epimerase
VQEIDRIASKHDFVMEFSSGFPYEREIEKKYLAARCRKLIHNYFPPPRIPFVLNLASLNETTWKTSLRHAKKAMRLAKRGGASFYSVHAGFCFDPEPQELGRPLTRYTLGAPRRRYWERFVKGLSILLKEASRLGIDLLIENNVVSEENREVPLLCADLEENQRLLTSLSHPRLGLTVDTGHLKVSAKTLGFSADHYVRSLHQRIWAFHHSDNDGRADLNEPLKPGYWFLKYMSQFESATHILEIVNLTVPEVKAQINILRRAMVSAC